MALHFFIALSSLSLYEKSVHQFSKYVYADGQTDSDLMGIQQEFVCAWKEERENQTILY